MPQAKLLHLVARAAEIHMSDLVHALGVSLSTVSGLVDRLVDQGLATRRDDPADRRQVVVALTAAGHGLPRPLPRPQRAPDAHAPRAPRRDDDLASVDRAVDRPRPAPPSPPPAARGRRPPSTPERIPHEPPVRARRRQAQRHAAPGRRPVHRGHLRVGQPPAGAPAGHRVPGHHRHRAATRAPARPTSPTRWPSRSSARSRASRGSRRSSRRRPTRSRSSSPSSRSAPTSRRPARASSRTSQAPACRRRSSPTVTALNINPRRSIIASIAATTPDGLDEAARIARTEIVPGPPRIEGVASVDVTRRPRAAGPHHPRPGEARRGRRARSQQIIGRPPGEQPHAPVRPAPGRRRRRSRSRRSASSTRSTRSRDLVVGVAAAGQPGRVGATPSRGPARRRLRRRRRPADARRPPTPSRSATSARSSSSASPTTGYARTNGQPALTLTVTKTSTPTPSQVADAVEAALTERRRAHAGVADRDHRVRTCPLHQGVAGRPAARGRPGRAVRGPHDLPVPVQPPLDAGRGDQHPAVGADGARGHAGRPASR